MGRQTKGSVLRIFASDADILKGWLGGGWLEGLRGVQILRLYRLRKLQRRMSFCETRLAFGSRVCGANHARHQAISKLVDLIEMSFSPI